MKKKIRGLSLDTILFSLIICINVVRFVLKITETSFVIYSIFGAFILSSFFLNQKKLIDNTKSGVPIILLFTIGYVLFVGLFTGLRDFSTIVVFLKLLFIVLLSIATFIMPLSKIKCALFLIVLINLAYSFVIIINAEIVYLYIESGSNYLNVTTSIALSLTICLCSLIYSLFSGFKWKRVLLLVLLSAIFFLSLSKFNARGNILFPVLIAVFMALFMGFRKKSMMIPVFLIIGIVGFVGIQIFLNNASEYLVSRFTSLFSNVEGEDRLEIWDTSLRYISENCYYIFGGGIGVFEESPVGFYPHNIFIQILGEYGVIGILMLLIMLFLCAKCSAHYNHIFMKNKQNNSYGFVFYSLVGSGIFYLLTFSKSFSAYDAYPFFMIISVFLNMHFNYCFSKGKLVNNRYEYFSFA